MQPLISGHVAPGFENVRLAFEANFARRGEVGAACAVFHDGQNVVDLWGGFRDTRAQKKWEATTLVPVFSTTKGIAALTLAVAVSKGLLDYEAKVSTYWPEFARHGKEAMTVRQLMSFQGGVCYLDGKPDEKLLANFDELARQLAGLKPAWKPGDYHGYHLFTAGWCASELIRRTDPKRRSLGVFFQEEVAQPLGVEFYIGTPPDIPENRIAELIEFAPAALLGHLNTLPLGLVLNLFVPNSLTRKVMFNLRIKKPADMIRPPYRQVEIPGGNGIGSVRGMARLYGEFATGGNTLGLNPATLDALRQPARLPTFGRWDRVLKTNMVYSLGFVKPFREFAFSPSETAFGGAGTGGSNAFADPEARLGFAYAPNKLGFHQFNDPREKALCESVYACLAAL